MKTSSVNHWLVKQEPTAYSWEQFVRDKQTAWTGVRNYQARKNLGAMRNGDLVLFYHSVIGKEVVGCAEVVREGYPDSTASVREEGWICVDLRPVAALRNPVSLDAIKTEGSLDTIPLLRQSRLSVMPLSPVEFQKIVALGGGLATPVG